MTVRMACSSEHDEIRALLTAAYAQYADAVSVRALFDRYLAEVLDLDAGDGVSLLVVESAGRIAGTAMPGGHAAVPARRMGVGADVLSLHTMSFMPDAVRLCERPGYRRAPEQDIDVAAHFGVGGEMDALAYRLDLRS